MGLAGCATILTWGGPWMAAAASRAGQGIAAFSAWSKTCRCRKYHTCFFALLSDASPWNQDHSRPGYKAWTMSTHPLPWLQAEPAQRPTTYTVLPCGPPKSKLVGLFTVVNGNSSKNVPAWVVLTILLPPFRVMYRKPAVSVRIPSTSTLASGCGISVAKLKNSRLLLILPSAE